MPLKAKWLVTDFSSFFWNHPNPKVREFVRFCIVGFTCTIIDSCIYYTFLTFAPYYVSLVCGYCLSLIVNYFLTIYWTFQTKANAKNGIGVICSHLINLFIVRMGMMFLLINQLGITEQLAFIPTLIISTITNFLLIRFIVHKV